MPLFYECLRAMMGLWFLVNGGLMMPGSYVSSVLRTERLT